jgi:hypothetical protein
VGPGGGDPGIVAGYQLHPGLLHPAGVGDDRWRPVEDGRGRHRSRDRYQADRGTDHDVFRGHECDQVSPPAKAGEAQQYSLARILGIRFASTAPMGLLAWVVWPAVRDLLLWRPGLTFWTLMAAGMIWLFALSLITRDPRRSTSHAGSGACRVPAGNRWHPDRLSR